MLSNSRQAAPSDGQVSGAEQRAPTAESLLQHVLDRMHALPQRTWPVGQALVVTVTELLARLGLLSALNATAVTSYFVLGVSPVSAHAWGVVQGTLRQSLFRPPCRQTVSSYCTQPAGGEGRHASVVNPTCAGPSCMPSNKNPCMLH